MPSCRFPHPIQYFRRMLNIFRRNHSTIPPHLFGAILPTGSPSLLGIILPSDALSLFDATLLPGVSTLCCAASGRCLRFLPKHFLTPPGSLSSRILPTAHRVFPVQYCHKHSTSLLRNISAHSHHLFLTMLLRGGLHVFSAQCFVSALSCPFLERKKIFRCVETRTPSIDRAEQKSAFVCLPIYAQNRHAAPQYANPAQKK